MNIRPSRFQTIARCPASLSLGEGFGSDRANLGCGVHLAGEYLLKSEFVDWDKLALSFGLDDEELEEVKINYYILRKLKFDGVDFFTWLTGHPDAEIFIETPLHSELVDISGRPDSYFLYGDARQYCILNDIKSGYTDVPSPKYNHQVRLYALMLFEKYPSLEFITVNIIQTRFKEIKTGTLERGDMEAYTDTVKEIIKRAKDEKSKNQFNVGSACLHCYLNFRCPAFSGAVKEFLSIWMNEQVTDETLPEYMAKALPVLKSMEYTIKKVTDCAKAYCVNNKTILTIDDETYFGITEEQQEEFIPEQAYKYIKDQFGDNVNLAVTFNKKRLQDACKKVSMSAGNLLEMLRETGVLVKKSVYKFTVQHK